MSSGIYRIGQKVTPRDHTEWANDEGFVVNQREMPQYGGEYTVSRFKTQKCGEPGMMLREFDQNYCFDKRDFRPLVDESVRRSVSFVTPTPVDA